MVTTNEQPSSRLRILHLVVQPVLVWDDGEELAPGPTVEPLTVRLSEIATFAADLPRQVAAQENTLSCVDKPNQGPLS
jgi:hypothetical protein